MGDFFKSKEVAPKVATVADPYKAIREPFISWLGGQVGKPAEQYGGEFVAPMSEFEKTSMDWLRQYGAGAPSKTRGLAQEEIQKTLGGEYDPTTSPYYQAVKAEAARNLESTQEDISGMAAGGGRYWTGARLGEQREAATDVGQGLNRFLGELAERERVRRLEVLPMAGEFAREEEQMPLMKAMGLQEAGALPRELQQALNEAIYGEWQRATQEYPLKIGQMAAGSQEAPLYGQVGYAPSGFEKTMTYMKDISEIIGNVAGMGGGGAKKGSYEWWNKQGKASTPPAGSDLSYFNP